MIIYGKCVVQICARVLVQFVDRTSAGCNAAQGDVLCLNKPGRTFVLLFICRNGKEAGTRVFWSVK